LDSSSGSGATLQGTVEQIKAAGGQAIAIPAAITQPDGARHLIEETIRQAGQVDILLNNAGLYPRSFVEDTSLEDWDSTVDINLNAVFYVTRSLLPSMLERGTGRIVNVSSELAIRHRPGDAVYSATKAAIEAFSYCLAQEVGPRGVEVNVWTPGYVRTDMTGQRAADAVETVEESFLWILAQTPMSLNGRILRKPDFGVTWGTEIVEGDVGDD
jgi:NAD(P)-dependent dehydrogenase (short-subunit alcohol dehydrogenase family)